MESELKTLESTLTEECGRLRAYFRRKDGWLTACGYVKGLLSKTERKNSWQLAETLGQATPYKFQHLLNGGVWDEGKVRDHNAALARAALGEAGTLVVDETGFIKACPREGGERQGVGRGKAAVQRYGRADRKLSDRGVRELPDGKRACIRRP